MRTIGGRGVYEVVAGGRRLKILQKLAAEGVIDADYKVPCKIEEPQHAVETSLVENTIRAAMHPADEFVAMAVLIDGGATIQDVARRFGASERHVKQRLHLGKLAPELSRLAPSFVDQFGTQLSAEIGFPLKLDGLRRASRHLGGDQC